MADPSSPDAAPPAEQLGGAVRSRRRRLGLTQQELADLSGVSVRFVHDLEHGKPTVRLAQLLLVLEALGLRVSVAPGRGPLVEIHE